MVVGILLQGLDFALSYVALSSGISSATVAMIVAMQPIPVAHAAPRLASEAVTRQTWSGLGLGLRRSALVISARSRVEVISTLGIHAACGRRLASRRGPYTRSSLAWDIIPSPRIPCSTRLAWALRVPLALAYLINGTSLVAMTLLLLVIRHGEVSRVSALFFLVPPLAAVIGWLILGEAMPPLAWVGLALAAAGVAIASGSAGTTRLRR